LTSARPHAPSTAAPHAEPELVEPQSDLRAAEALLAERYCFLSEAGYPIKRALALALRSTLDGEPHCRHRDAAS
jgi:hypothetical protein